jgi:two-component system NtrC family response regulator
VRKVVARVAASDANVLVRGETGTGKELVARAIHDGSPRAAGPLVAVNCGALPEHLVESELFGHRKGAFTGADEHRAGLFEVADGGTLFLDEVGELPKPLQSRLLRALESGEIRRVGDNQPITVDVRVVCATHRSLEEMVAAGDFREDLLFRINTFEIVVPPLRERLDDLPDLVQHFVRRARPQTPPEAALVAAEVLEAMTQHRWPGNVRELANVVEHALVLCDDLPLLRDHLPDRLGAARAGTSPARPEAAAAPQSATHPASAAREAVQQAARDVATCSRPLSLRELEMEAIQRGLERNQGNKARTAEELGISLKTLYNKLHQLQESLQEAASRGVA